MVLFAECPNTTLGFLKKIEGVGRLLPNTKQVYLAVKKSRFKILLVKKKITIMKVKLKCNFFFFFCL